MKLRFGMTNFKRPYCRKIVLTLGSP